MNTTTKRMITAAVLALPLLGGGTAMAQSNQASTHQSLPPGFHWSKTTRQMDDCGRHNKGKAKFIIWRGDSDQSVLWCPNGTVWPS